MSDAASSESPLDGVVNEDGSITVSREEAARLGLTPGSHLRLFPGRPRLTWAEISEKNAEWQSENGVEVSEEEAVRLAVEASRDIRKKLDESN